jgi:hypothetical protein
MSQNETDVDLRALPKPVVLTPEEARQIAVGTAGLLLISPLPTRLVFGFIINKEFGLPSSS